MTNEPTAFSQALDNHLEDLDKAYSSLRDLHSDRASINFESKQMKDAQEQFKLVSNRIFRLKEVWNEATR